VEEAIPIRRVADAETSMAWCTRLGYEEEWEHRFEPSFPSFVSIARHGTSRLFLSEHSGDAGEMPWAREVCLTDPDGNRLRIGTPST
jgi:hypothetical protein